MKGIIKFLLPVLLMSLSLFAQSTVPDPGKTVKAWVMLDSPVAITEAGLHTEQVIPVTDPDLLFIDNKNNTILSLLLTEDQLTYALYNENGKEKRRINVAYNSDMSLPAVTLNENEGAFFTFNSQGQAICYDYNGSVRWQKQLMEPVIFNYENSYFTGFDSSRNEYIAVFSQPAKRGSPSYTTYLFRLNAHGTIIKRKQFYGWKATVVVTNPRYGYALIQYQQHVFSSEETIRVFMGLYDAKLNEIWERFGLFREALFPDRNHIILMNKSDVTYHDIDNNKLLWRGPLSAEGEISQQIRLDEKGNTIYIKGKPMYMQGKLYFEDSRITVLSNSGRIVSESSLPGRKTVRRPILKSMGGQISIGGIQEIYSHLIPGTE